jgi:hypothetical protein
LILSLSLSLSPSVVYYCSFRWSPRRQRVISISLTSKEKKKGRSGILHFFFCFLLQGGVWPLETSIRIIILPRFLCKLIKCPMPKFESRLSKTFIRVAISNCFGRETPLSLFVSSLKKKSHSRTRWGLFLKEDELLVCLSNFEEGKRFLFFTCVLFWDTWTMLQLFCLVHKEKAQSLFLLPSIVVRMNRKQDTTGTRSGTRQLEEGEQLQM